jgi:SEC-C motif/Uncharacterised protein family (UPF0149)
MTSGDPNGGWIDPIGTFSRLQSAVRILASGDGPRRVRLDEATSALTGLAPEYFPKAMREKAERVLSVREKVRRDHANDWANGFLLGMEFGKEDWALLLDDEDHGGSLIAIFSLANEHNPDPKMRPYKDPISAELRETLIVGAAAGTAHIYRYFKAQRFLANDPLGNMPAFLRTMPKVGRNELCPCGSGKKFKQCCGKTTLH